ncbi:hypothetical protein P0M11_05905 [Kaistella sp. PBT33-4]|uniref:hypothetical protein n=1 Tax=Kaistella sp. PBT33-4 TaxID=3032000 RepID=UPI0023D8A632|nr:hypothetical protein [Kaistella sp. PBT33-4]MDF0719532.1 hypothetical protein [Kaistella sp. PBT33-4]
MHSTILIDDNELVIKDRLKYQKIFSIIAGTSGVLFALTTFMNGGESFTYEKFYYYFLFLCGISLIFFSLKLNVRDRLSKDEILLVNFQKDVFRFEHAYFILQNGKKRKTYFFPDEKEKLISFLEFNNIKIRNSKYIKL